MKKPKYKIRSNFVSLTLLICCARSACVNDLFIDIEDLFHVCVSFINANTKSFHLGSFDWVLYDKYSNFYNFVLTSHLSFFLQCLQQKQL